MRLYGVVKLLVRVVQEIEIFSTAGTGFFSDIAFSGQRYYPTPQDVFLLKVGRRGLLFV